jgi:DNA uptake protein ComE-like DNA-binding protein
VLSGPAILRISVLLIIAGLLAAVVQFLLPSPAPEPASRPASPAASSPKPAPMAEAPAAVQPGEPPSPPAASAEPVREPPAPPRAAAVPAAPAQMPSDALAVPSDPAAPPEAQAPDAAGQAEIDRAEDTAGPRAVAVVDLNTASVADLNRLRGGGAIGRAIVAKRPYTSVDQLLSKRVLSRSVYERIRDQVTVR